MNENFGQHHITDDISLSFLNDFVVDQYYNTQDLMDEFSEFLKDEPGEINLIFKTNIITGIDHLLNHIVEEIDQNNLYDMDINVQGLTEHQFAFFEYSFICKKEGVDYKEGLLEELIKKYKQETKKEKSKVLKYNSDNIEKGLCPCCGTKLIYQEKCKSCPGCNWTACG